MSWDQGIALREDIPGKFRAWADRQGEKRNWGTVEYITWFGMGRVIYLDYGESGSLKLDLTGTKFDPLKRG